MAEEGYIKFSCEWIKAEPLPLQQIESLNWWRERLYELGLVGAYSDGVGFGNLSQRLGGSEQFIITGSATGNLEHLTECHYTTVSRYDIERNFLCCEGPIKASSESLTHGAVYVAAPEVEGVIHIHSLALWEKLKDNVPTTSSDAEYGTPEMAREVMRLVHDGGKSGADRQKIIVMAGHREGIIAYGRSLDEAGELLIRRYFELK
jgi:L-ribulose-5-phosphate 4-epimerase